MTTAAGSDEKQKDTERSPGVVEREEFIYPQGQERPEGQHVSLGSWGGYLETLAQIWARELRKDPG